MPSFFVLTWGDTIILLVTCFNQSISALFMSVHIVILDPPKKAYIVTLPDVCLDVHSACVCVGGGVIILLAGYLPDVHSVCVWGRGGVIILLAGYLPDVHSVCVCVCVGGGGGGSSFCLLITYLMSILCVWGVGGGSSFCLLITYLMSILCVWGGHHSAC